MQKRRYTRIKAIETEILRMHWEGETHRAIAEVYGLEREQVKKFLKRHREKQALLREGQTSKPKGRPRKDGQPPRQNPETELAEKIRECQDRTDKTYGYRRVWKWLKDRNIKRNPKTVLRVMKKHGLLSEIRRSRKWVNLGQQIHKYKNHLNRQFWANRPNAKWVTDISYIHTKEGVLYLSMIRDLYDNSIVAYKTATRQTVNLVLDTIRLAMKKEKKRVAAELQLHSDQGFQYTSQAYFKLTQSYGITPSMSSKGNPYDNAMAENFFSILKTECIYRHKPKTFKEANDLIDKYIHFYNYERIQNKTGVAPLTLRHSA